jgi:hypothetical protein
VQRVLHSPLEWYVGSCSRIHKTSSRLSGRDVVWSRMVREGIVLQNWGDSIGTDYGRSHPSATRYTHKGDKARRIQCGMGPTQWHLPRQVHRILIARRDSVTSSTSTSVVGGWHTWIREMELCPPASYHRLAAWLVITGIHGSMCVLVLQLWFREQPLGKFRYMFAARRLPSWPRSFPSASLLAAAIDDSQKEMALRSFGIASRTSLFNPGFPIPLYRRTLSPLLSASIARPQHPRWCPGPLNPL